jgi:hypothetical protein
MQQVNGAVLEGSVMTEDKIEDLTSFVICSSGFILFVSDLRKRKDKRSLRNSSCTNSGSTSYKWTPPLPKSAVERRRDQVVNPNFRLVTS